MANECEARSIRDQLVLEEQRDLFDYWTAKCAAGKRAPARADIDPVDIPRLLPSVSLIETGASLQDAQYRLAGTRLRDLFGREATGQAMIDLIGAGKQDYWQVVYDRVVGQVSPACGVCPCPAETAAPSVHFWMRLPLIDDSGKVTLMLGHDWLLEESKARAKARHAGLNLAEALGA